MCFLKQYEKSVMILDFNKLILLVVDTSSYLYFETWRFWEEGNRSVNV